MIFGVCGPIALFLSILVMRGQISNPFLVPKTALEIPRAFYAQQNAEDQQTENMKKQDTDHDGMSDYSETYIYHTSSYLADSDSDGIPDPIEIAMGTDPNCPKGETCVEPLVSGDTIATSTPNAFSDLLVQTSSTMPTTPAIFATGGSSAPSVSGIGQPPPPDTMTPDKIRSFLVENGFATQQVVSNLPDDTLIKLYGAAYEEALRVQIASQGGTPLTGSINGFPVAPEEPTSD